MKAMMLLGGGVLLVAAVIAAGCQKPGEPEAPMPGMPMSSGAATEEAPAQKLCPVTGEPIDPNISVEYEGRRIYFCCANCPETFKQDPLKYIRKVDEELSGALARAARTQEPQD